VHAACSPRSAAVLDELIDRDAVALGIARSAMDRGRADRGD